jgi:chromosome segregation ATPase
MKKLLLLLVASFAPAAGAAFKCVDEKGITHFGDTPPAGCDNVVMYEVSRTGTVLRKIEPSLTPEQIKAKQDEFERVKASLKTEGAQKRKDQALINTFSSEREFDVARDRNIEPLTSRIKSAEERIKAVDKRAKELEEEMEFYKAGKSKAKSAEAPATLTGDLQRVKAERVTLVANIARYEKEIEQVRQKFEVDKQRWVALKNPSSAKPAEPPPAEPKAAPKAAKKGAEPAKDPKKS